MNYVEQEIVSAAIEYVTLALASEEADKAYDRVCAITRDQATIVHARIARNIEADKRLDAYNRLKRIVLSKLLETKDESV